MALKRMHLDGRKCHFVYREHAALSDTQPEALEKASSFKKRPKHKGSLAC